MTTPLKRRDFIKAAAGIGAGAAASVIGTPAIASGKLRWKMVMSWQKVLPGLGTGAVRLANRITGLSDGRLTVEAYGGGELVPPQGVFDAVSQGTAELGHSAAYYWLNKSRSAAFFCAVPGGLTAQEQNGWLYFGGGQQLWDELYEPFGVRSFPAGNTGVQMGGWFKKEVKSLADIKGLKMRMPGLAGEVFTKLGGSSQNIPAQELFTALQSGVIDGAEWVGPWNDMALGFHRVTKFYYGPAFQEGGPNLELMINRKAFDKLPKDLQLVVRCACATENDLMTAEYHANNIKSMQLLKQQGVVQVRQYPDDVLQAMFKTSEEIVAATAELGELNKRIYESYARYRKFAMDYEGTTERTYLNARAKASGI
jgi:TRAP-type mannitol/chloroaromatic compound transport system substrate-binding protein